MSVEKDTIDVKNFASLPYTRGEVERRAEFIKRSGGEEKRIVKPIQKSVGEG